MGNTCVSVRGGPHAGADPSSSTGGAAAAKTTKLGTIEQQQEREREEGQQQLRDIVAAADREGIALDWSALIKKAEELHHRAMPPPMEPAFVPVAAWALVASGVCQPASSKT